MVLNLKTVYDGGSPLDFDYGISEERLAAIKGYAFDVFKVKGSVFERADVVNLKYSADFTLKAECDRCLKPFKREFSCVFGHILVRSTENDNDEYIVTEGDRLDLDDIAIQDALLKLPAKLLCREDCKGLCYICGADLNEGECGCERQQ